jgi:hypothetical protein
MSIYCSIFDFGYDHSTRCKRIRRVRPSEYEQDDSQPCTCGGSPIAYQGSNVLPSDGDKRDGLLGLAAIPSHITRDGRDDKPEGGAWYPWLRVGLSAGRNNTILLTSEQVRELRDALDLWLDHIPPTAPTSRQRSAIARKAGLASGVSRRKASAV